MKNRRKRKLRRWRMLALLSLVGLLCCSAVAGLLSSCADLYAHGHSDEEPIATAGAKQDMTVLVLGNDRSGKLTDVIMLVHLDRSDLSVRLVQIPRDTYAVYSDRNYKKLNGACAVLGEEGLCEFLERSLGVEIDHYLSVGLDAFAEIVDAIGGVNICLPEDYVYDDPEQNLHIRLSAGEQLLNGEQAEQFVRYRSGYLQADLGRMDAQKMFLSCLIENVKTKITLPSAVKIIRSLYGKVKTDIPMTECFMLMSDLLKVNLGNVTMLTLAGEAVQNESGSWYYVLNRSAASEEIGQYLHGSDFDPNGVFTDASSSAIHGVYHRGELRKKIYAADELQKNGIRIPSAQNRKNQLGKGSVPIPQPAR